MGLQSSGSISLNDIAGEFGGSTPHSLNEYYGAASGVPASGAISLADFYGTSSTPSFITVIQDQTYSIRTTGFHVDSASNLYNLHSQPGGNRSAVVTKLNEEGGFQWATAIDFKTNTPRDLSTDNSGNVYVVGYAHEDNSSGYNDINIAKLNSSGTLQWSRNLGNQSMSYPLKPDYGHTISTDGSGNSYISGYESTYDNNVFLVKYNSSGTIQWQRRINGLAGTGVHTAIDSAGYIYLGSNMRSGRGISPNIVINKWNSSGSVIWSKKIEGVQYITSMAVDESNNIYMSCSNSSQAQFTIFKFNSSGTLQWQKQVSAGFIDREANLTTTTSGNIIANYKSFDPNYTRSYSAVIALDASGNVQWQRTLSDNANTLTHPIVTDGQSNTKGFISCAQLSGDRQVIFSLPADGSKTGTHVTHWDNTFIYASSTRASVTNSSFSVTDITNSYSVVSMSLPTSSVAMSVTQNSTSSKGVKTL